jgi:hypothetical protein
LGIQQDAEVIETEEITQPNDWKHYGAGRNVCPFLLGTLEQKIVEF